MNTFEYAMLLYTRLEYKYIQLFPELVYGNLECYKTVLLGFEDKRQFLTL